VKNDASAEKRKEGKIVRKETPADKPLDFENCPIDLSCLIVHAKISCCHQLSELLRTYQNNYDCPKK